jgi:hypothetical protein
VQEAALLAGAGIAYGAPSYTEYRAWPAAVRTAWTRVLAAVASTPALAPAAARERIPSAPAASTYAFVATSPDEPDDGSAVLLAFNLGDEPATVTVDLSSLPRLAAGAPPPVDLVSHRPFPPVTTSAAYALRLPAHGSALLPLATTSR